MCIKGASDISHRQHDMRSFQFNVFQGECSVNYISSLYKLWLTYDIRHNKVNQIRANAASTHDQKEPLPSFCYSLQ